MCTVWEDKFMSANENEKEAVRTTIVGGRPPGSGRNNCARDADDNLYGGIR